MVLLGFPPSGLNGGCRPCGPPARFMGDLVGDLDVDEERLLEDLLLYELYDDDRDPDENEDE